MKLNTEIIRQALEGEIPVRCRGRRDLSLHLGRPEYFLPGGRRFLAGHLYVARGEQLPQRPEIERGAALLCVGESTYLPYYLEDCCVLQAGERTDLCRLFNLLTAVYDRYDAWSQRLSHVLATSGSVREMITCSQEIFGNPLFVLNREFHFLAQSSYSGIPLTEWEKAASRQSGGDALDAWMNTYTVALGYLLVPEKLTGSDAVSQRLTQMGFASFYHLKLGYVLEREDSLWGIDAKSGEPLGYTWQAEDSGLTYSDIAGTWAEADVLRLAQFNVGYAGGTFQHTKELTQWDLICLLYSLNGYPMDPESATEAERNEVYATAYRMGILTRADRNDDALLTRSQLVQYLLDGAGYGSVAKLEGIFTCSYTDRASIPASEMGYAALAQGLGLISGTYAGTATATRGQAAAMLERLMER